MAENYEALIEEVRVIDEDAANYMEGDAKKLPDFIAGDGCSNQLVTVFPWRDTPQGQDFWRNIDTQLN